MVEWLDSFGRSGWEEKDCVDAWPIPCVSVGILLKDESDYITMILSMGVTQCCGSITIPKCSITRMRYLKVDGNRRKD